MVENKRIPEGYKNTEVGIIPEDWEVVKLNEICMIKRGASPRPIQEYLTNNLNGIHWIKIGDVDKTGLITNTKEMIKTKGKSRSVFVNKGDLILSNSMSFGKPYLLEISGCIHDGWLSIKQNSDIIDKKFLYYILSSHKTKKYFSLMAAGSGVQNLNKKIVSKLNIPIPLYHEQKAIAKVLSDIDSLIESLKKLIAKKQKIKKGTMQELLNDEKRLSGFNKGWELKKLKHIIDFTNGKAHESSILNRGKYIVINSKFISSEGKVIKYSNKDFCLASKGEIVMVMSDVPNGKAIAKCFYIDKNHKYTVNQRICLLKSIDVDSEFLYYKIDRHPYYLSFDDGVKQTNLRKNDVLNCELNIPKSIKEQKAIAQILSDMDAEIEKLEKKFEKYKLIKKGMMQELLTGRIRLL